MTVLRHSFEVVNRQLEEVLYAAKGKSKAVPLQAWGAQRVPGS